MNHPPGWWRRILGATMIGLGQAIGMPLRAPFHVTVASPEQLDDNDEEIPFDLVMSGEAEGEAGASGPDEDE